MHCILSRGTGIEFCSVPSHCGLHWNEISGRLTKQGAIKNKIKNVSQISHNNRLLLFREIYSRPEKTVCIKSLKNKETCDIFLLKVLSRSNMEAMSKFTEH